MYGNGIISVAAAMGFAIAMTEPNQFGLDDTSAAMEGTRKATTRDLDMLDVT